MNVTRNLYGGLPVDGTIRNETTKDVVNDLLTYKAAAKLKVRQAIAKKQQWKRYNRRMSGWAKGVLAEALDSVCEQRDAEHVLVNGAYTSQMDSTTGRLQGRRVGDKFYRVTGDVLQADHNAALNVLARLADPEIKRFTPYRDVKRLLLARSPAPLSVKRLELGGSPRQVRINPYEQVCSR